MTYFGIIDKNVAAIFQLQCKIGNISDMFLHYFVLCGFHRNYWTDPYEILYTYLAHAWLLLDLGLYKNYDFY